MPDPKSIAGAYLASWNATPQERLSALAAWSSHAIYTDPLMTGNGRDGIAAMMDRAVEQFPGHRFELAGTPDGHSAFVRFSWTLHPESGPPVAAGTDVVRLDDKGVIMEVIGFLDGVGE